MDLLNLLNWLIYGVGAAFFGALGYFGWLDHRAHQRRWHATERWMVRQGATDEEVERARREWQEDENVHFGQWTA